jgi:hypothetical protein
MAEWLDEEPGWQIHFESHIVRGLRHKSPESQHISAASCHAENGKKKSLPSVKNSKYMQIYVNITLRALV